MKKFLSVVLAITMLASSATMSFAVSKQTPRAIRKSATLVEVAYKDKGGKLIPGVYGAYGPYAYDVDDDKKLTQSAIEYGETAYYILTDKDGVGITNSDSVDGLKFKAAWEEGSKLAKGVSVSKKKISNVIGKLIPTANQYYYMIAITIEKSSSTSDADIIGTLTLNKTKSPKVKDLELAVELNVNWAHSYIDSGKDYIVTGDIDGLKAEQYYSLKFDSDDEVEMEFEDGSVFTVDVSGQGKTLVYFDTKFNSKIASQYPLAELNFWNGNGAKFNRTGELFLAVKNYDSDAFLYELKSDGTLTKVVGADYDDKEEGFYFKTRALGSYVVSDMELSIKAPESEKVPVITPVTPVTPVNPGTGAKA